MPLSEIKEGMVGYGLSVFQGTKIEKFDVKVVGIVRRVLNGRDAILVRLSGKAIGNNNVIRGMSGSPVYLDGRLVGAVSYGFDFAKEPLAGVTPIADMVDAFTVLPDVESQPKGPGFGMSPLSKKSKDDTGGANEGSGQSGPTGSLQAEFSGRAPKLVPLMSPVALAGFSPRAEAFLQDHFGKSGLLASSGSAGALDETLATASEAEIKPGSSLSVMLTTGDFSSSATGTTTVVAGNRVLAYGHPFLQAGAVDFPMATAYVHDVMPSLNVSFKLASPVKTVGALVADRPWSVGGELNRTPHLIPADYVVEDRTRGLTRSFHCQIVDHPELTPELVAATAMSAIDSTHQSSAPYIIKMASSFEVNGANVISRTDKFPSNLNPRTAVDAGFKIRFPADPVGTYLLDTTSKIVDNDFEKANLQHIKLHITIEDGHKTAVIERVATDKSIVQPGDKIKIACLIHPYNEPRQVRNLVLTIPNDVPDGDLLIGVSAGDDLDSLRKKMGLVDPPIRSFENIAEKVARAGRADSLCAVMSLPQQSIVLDGAVIPDPPAHWGRLFFSDRFTNSPTVVRAEQRTSLLSSWLLDGGHIISVEVERKDKAQKRSSLLPIAEKGTHSVSESLYTTERAKKAIEAIKKADSSSPSTPEKPAQVAPPTFWSVTKGTERGKDYPHIHPMLVWRQENEESFRQGRGDAVMVDMWGRLNPGFPEVLKKPLDIRDRIWSGVVYNGDFYFAASTSIFKWNKRTGESLAIAQLKTSMVPDMVVDSKGRLYAALVPDGKVVSLDLKAIKPGEVLDQSKSEKNISTVFAQKGPIITSLALDDKDNLYVGMGGGQSSVYKVANNNCDLVFSGDAGHVTSLFFSPYDQRIYLGTGEPGSVFSIPTASSAGVGPKAEYESPDHIVSGVAKDKAGNLFVATAGPGHLTRVRTNGQTEVVENSEGFYKLFYDKASDSIFAGDGEGDITTVREDPVSKQSFFMPVCHTGEEMVTALAADNHGYLFAGTANLSCLSCYDMNDKEGAHTPTYTSPVKDALRPSRWTKLHVYGAYNEYSQPVLQSVTAETRSGGTSIPDSSWTKWQPAKADTDGFAVMSEPGRFFQYRLSWKPGAAAKDIVGKVEVTYRPSNQTPQFASVSLKPNFALSGKEEVNVLGVDQDGDNLLLSIDIAGDPYQKWQPLERGLRPKSTGESSAPDKAETQPNKSAKKEKTEEAADDKDKTDSDDKDTADPPAKLKTPSDAPMQPEPTNGKGVKNQAVKLDTETDDKAEDKSEDKTKNKDGDQRSKDKPTLASAKSTGKPASPLKPTPANYGGGEKFTWNFDTSKLKEGKYLIRFTLDDSPSNAIASQTASVVRAVIVDNTAPVIKSVECLRQANGSLMLKVSASDELSEIGNATYRVDKEEPFALAAENSGIDAKDVELVAPNVIASTGSHKIEVQVTDRAGNTSTKTINVR